MVASYVEARKCEFLVLTRGYRSVVEYKVEFLQLNRYAGGFVANDYK